MQLKSIFDLLMLKIEGNIDLPSLLAQASPQEWQNESYNTLIKVLDTHPLIDWKAYLENNPDIAESGINPANHYLTHGMFEGRKLKFRKSGRNIIEDACQRPSVTIIIASYNNELFLGKCLDSVINQTLNNIEIIIIDDYSTDNAPEIIKNYANADKRIRTVFFDKNCSQHHSRIIGVNMARGKYVMFLDSDDFLCVDACEKAYEAINDKFDIVCFNTNIISHIDVPMVRIDGNIKYLNQPQAGIYDKIDIFKCVFIYRTLNATLWNKIYKTEICKKAFREMEDGYYPGAQDLYEFICLAQNSNNLYKIDEYLYNYNMGTGASFKNQFITNPGLFATPGDIFKPIATYCEANGLNFILDSIKINLLSASIDKWLNEVPEHRATEYFDIMVSQYGLADVVKVIIQNYSTQWEMVARKVKFLRNVKAIHQQSPIRRIGIFYHRISVGGVESLINSLCGILLKCGYEPVLILENKTEYDLVLPSGVAVHYVHTSLPPIQNMKVHVQEMALLLAELKLDIILYQAGLSQALLWDLILCRYYDIPIIVTLHSDFNFNYLPLPGNYGPRPQEKVLSCADKVICLSPFTELFLRSKDIDAVYIPNPVKPVTSINRKNKPEPVIIVTGRLSDKLKCIPDTLRIIHNVKKRIPHIKTFYIGDFVSSKDRQEFFNMAKSLQISDNIILTGWTHSPEDYYDKGSLLLSTSYTEGFSLAIAEAQAHGLPCVIYNLPIIQKRDNPSIITVPFGAVQDAAQAIENLLEDPQKWYRLSEAAVKSSERFGLQRYEKEITILLNTFSSQSIWKHYDYRNVSEIIKSMTFYACRNLPI